MRLSRLLLILAFLLPAAARAELACPDSLEVQQQATAPAVPRRKAEYSSASGPNDPSSSTYD